jgi:DnaJ-class molecular chaperone
MEKHANPQNCGMCGGSGTITINNDNKEVEVTCPTCRGSGKA